MKIKGKSILLDKNVVHVKKEFESHKIKFGIILVNMLGMGGDSPSLCQQGSPAFTLATSSKSKAYLSPPRGYHPNNTNTCSPGNALNLKSIC